MPAHPPARTSADFIYAAQLNSDRTAYERLGLKGILARVRWGVEAARLDLLIIGGEEIPELYRALTDQQQRAASQVFLWYPVLADNPAMQPGFRVVNYRGVESNGWRSPAAAEEVGETFSFGCPNHPELRQAVLDGVERQLDEYPFDGVFLDKIRFPSPANGLEEVLSCFCPFCRAAAAREGLDLDEVRSLLYRLPASRKGAQPDQNKSLGSGWLEKLLAGLAHEDHDLLAHAIRFRERAITRLVEDFRALTVRKGVELALDLFSPGLAALVGQDYTALAGLAAWVKPMTYRYAFGPAGLRLEIPQLMRGMENYLGLAQGEAEQWLQVQSAGMAGTRTGEIERDGVPAQLIAAEMGQAVRWMGDTPVYMGVEAVSIPAFNIRITPAQVRESIIIARELGAKGAVLSWDLLEMPMDNLLAARG